MHIKVVIASRIRDKGIVGITDEYRSRMRRGMPTDIVEIDTRKPDGGRKLLAATEGFHRVALDAGGRTLDSEGFSEFLGDLKDRGRDVAFIIGAAEGLPQSVRDNADSVLSLSRMTMAHRVALVVLTEQLYRAMTIMENHPYHK